MDSVKLSDCFKTNFLLLKIFGLWPDNNFNVCYKCYLALVLCFYVITFNILLVVNFIFTPREIESMIWEVIFLFTEVTVMGKVFMVLLMRDKLFAIFNILDCEAFEGNDKKSRQIVESYAFKYKKYWRMYTCLGHLAFSLLVLLPIFSHLIFNTNIELPMCKYHFLDREVVRRHFIFLYIYQSIGVYTHMHYNNNIDTLVTGLMFMAIAQVKVLKHELKSLKVIKEKNIRYLREDRFLVALNKHLLHYEVLLQYCNLVQDIVGVTMFILISMASIMICVVLCGLFLATTIDTLIFMVTYLIALIIEIFVPCWLGTQLEYQSGELVLAAYSSEWIPRSERFKRSLKLFMVRANTNIVITGWIFPLSLDIFTSIMKTAYSFFALIRNFQGRK